MRQGRLITVFGGTGFLGTRVVLRLLRAGHRVRIAARHPDRKPELLCHDRAEACYADLFEPDSLRRALQGADGAVNATSLYVERGDLTYHSIHVEAAARLARLATQAGIRRFVQLSGIGADPDADDPYIQARGQGEKAVRADHVNATLLRSSVMFGKDDALLSAIRSILCQSPVYPLFGSGETLMQPACVKDVADAVCRALETDCGAQTYELGGADIVTYRELADFVAAQLGRPARTVPVPFALWQPLAGIAEHLPGAPLTRAQVALMRIDNVVSGDLPGMMALGIAPCGVVGHLRATCSADETN